MDNNSRPNPFFVFFVFFRGEWWFRLFRESSLKIAALRNLANRLDAIFTARCAASH